MSGRGIHTGQDGQLNAFDFDLAVDQRPHDLVIAASENQLELCSHATARVRRQNNALQDGLIDRRLWLLCFQSKRLSVGAASDDFGWCCV